MILDASDVVELPPDLLSLAWSINRKMKNLLASIIAVIIEVRLRLIDQWS